MSFSPGEDITAERLNRYTPAVYIAPATATLTGPQTNGLVPGASVTFTTKTANAMYVAWYAIDFDRTAAVTGLISGRISVDGSVTGQYAVFRASDSVGRATTSNMHTGTLASAGSHTISMVANLVTSTLTNLYSTLTVMIYEVV